MISTCTLAAEPELRVQARLQPATSVVGGLVQLQLDVLTDTWFTDAPELPDLALAGTLVTPPDGHAENLTQTLDGKSFTGLRFRYLISPTVAQDFELPSLTVRTTLGQASATLKAHSQPLHLITTLAPGFNPGEPVFVAQGLRFSQTVINSATPLKVGDSLTRQLMLQADGALAMSLPTPALAEVPGLSRYWKDPQVSPLRDGRGAFIGGQRIDSASYRIDSEGHYTLPAIRIKWWDVSGQQLRIAQVPAVTFEAVTNSADQPVFSISNELNRLGQSPALNLSLLCLGGLTLLFGVTLLACWRAPLVHRACRGWQARRHRRQAAWRQSATYAWQQVLPQLKARPPQLSALYLWRRRASASLTLDLASHLPGLLRACYGREPTHDQALRHLRQTLTTLHNQGARTRRSIAPALRPLNPVSQTKPPC